MSAYTPVEDEPTTVPENGIGQQINGAVADITSWLEVHEVYSTSQTVVADTYKKYKGFVFDGPFSYRVACLLAGGCMAFFGLIGIFVEGGFMNTLINFYQLGFGLLTIGLEVHKPVIDTKLRQFLFEYFRFLFTLVGRGCFYILVGIIVLSSKPWTNFLVGLFTTGTGVASLYYGFKANAKLNELKGKHNDEVAARQAFVRVDTDGDGVISVGQFAVLLKDLGCEMGHQELEAAVAVVGDDMERSIQVDRFCEWYNDFVLSGQKKPAPVEL